ncbi:WhiB family transcriptional regulator [Kitasatospora purpeofusca]|uniref:WhiB family transcriptional regulator n=1 Tax=Kitasatospora purpeofusca TaxID=67352 RepID=UPI00365476EB
MIPATTTPLPCTAAPALFFAPDNERAIDRAARVGVARTFCNACPVRTECMAEPRTGEQGVWGGLDEHDRAKATGSRVRHDRPVRVRVPARCGTTGGAAKHRRQKEKVCRACLAAERADCAERRAKRAAQAAA